MGCGIKNSEGCPTPAPVVVSPSFPFRFVDQDGGLWSTFRTFKYNDVFECPQDSSVVFHFPRGTHDVVKVNSQIQFDQCDLSDAAVLFPATYEEFSPSIFTNHSMNEMHEMGEILHDMPDVSYYHKCSGEVDSMEFITCSLPGHCKFGQKIALQVTPKMKVDDVEVPMHVDSLHSLLTLLGARNDPDTGFLIMDRGYQTEQLANQTLEWIWCGIDHCPYMAMDAWDDPSMEDCISILYLLLGFVNRNRPIPRFEEAEEYYRMAIAGSNNTDDFIHNATLLMDKSIPLTSRNECAARSYLSKLFIDKGDYMMAKIEAENLCVRCGEDPDSKIAIRQAKSEFDSLANAGFEDFWPQTEACTNFFLPSSPPSSIEMRSGAMHLLNFNGIIIFGFSFLSFMFW